MLVFDIAHGLDPSLPPICRAGFTCEAARVAPLPRHKVSSISSDVADSVVVNVIEGAWALTTRIETHSAQ